VGDPALAVDRRARRVVVTAGDIAVAAHRGGGRRAVARRLADGVIFAILFPGELVVCRPPFLATKEE